MAIEPIHVLLAAFVLVVFVASLPALRERYEEPYEDERAFLADNYPRAWTLVGHPDDHEGSDHEGSDREGGDREGSERPARCPACGTENVPGFSYCRDCNRPLPRVTE